MDHHITKFSLNIPLSPHQPEPDKFNLLSETESERLNSYCITSQINELKAQLEIVNEDRQRLKKENERLRAEKHVDFSKALSIHMEAQKVMEGGLQQEVWRLRKECEEKEKLLNAMRSLLGSNYELLGAMKENQNKASVSPIKVSNRQSRLPGTRSNLKANRSISPYTKCV